jgi:hypothetical protein
MPRTTERAAFLADLLEHIQEHSSRVAATFAELDDAELAQRPAPREWSVLECFEHLVLTFDYYRPKLAAALAAPARTPPDGGPYAPSNWGRIYMYFALNPRYSFPTAGAITPTSAADRSIFAAYLARQAELVEIIQGLDGVDLTRTRIPIEKGVQFNLGDVLKILVYHDEVHFLQAQRVLDALHREQGHAV